MLVPVSWLRDFAPVGQDVAELVAALDDLGLVVEEVRRVGEGLGDVVLARVGAIAPIEGADRIRRVEVDAGDGPVEVVCGAWNFAVGDLVPLAPVGAVLPGGFEITRRRMKGVTSSGMLCSAAELGLGEDGGGILLVGSSPEASPGAPLATVLGIQPDVVLDVAVEANRPDAMCMAGVARDVAARLGLPFAIPATTADPAGFVAGGPVSVVIEAEDLCTRFLALLIEDVRVGPSPPWLAWRLELAGMRSLNNVVDASNYVMLELGQPTHPYDAALLSGPGFVVRAAEPGEVVVTLDGQQRRLGDGPTPDCLICDAQGRPVGIAGVMGGASSEISEATRSVVLEAAHFAPMAVARTSKRLGLRSEASARFERGCDPDGIERAIARYCDLLALTGAVEQGRGPYRLAEASRPARKRAPIRVRTDRVNAVLGTRLVDADVSGYLGPIGFEANLAAAGVHEVRVPGFRPDVASEIDVVEEVARHHGYSRIPRTMPAVTRVGRLSPRQRERRQLRQILLGAGCTEAFPLSLVGPGDHERVGLMEPALALSNPLAREESLLRASQRPGLLRALLNNAGHRVYLVRLFEIGHVHGIPAESRSPLPEERESLAVILASPFGEDAGALGARAVWEAIVEGLGLAGTELSQVSAGEHASANGLAGLHPTRSARLTGARGAALGAVGELDPAVTGEHGLGRVGWLEVDLARLAEEPRRPDQARPVSRFPSSDVDLAFVVDDDAPAAAVERTLREAAGEQLVGLWLFDVFRDDRLGARRRSLAYRLRFAALDRTLTDREVAAVRRRCIDAVEVAHPAELRA
ncbi:MAG: phenylalanine--tRNA ligase subunit beta [Acidimicrobiales bacterium]